MKPTLRPTMRAILLILGLLTGLGAHLPAEAAERFAPPRTTALDSNGDPLSGAKLNFYTTGTSTPLDTYSDDALTTPNANPVVADSAGRFGEIFLQALEYKVVLTDADDVTIWTADPVDGAVAFLGDSNTFTGAVTFTSSFPLRDTSATSTAGPVITCDRDSASPAANDIMCEIDFVGEDDAGNDHTYAEMRINLVSPTDGSERGYIAMDASDGLNFTIDSAGVTQTDDVGSEIIWPQNYISGCKLANAADTSHDIRLESCQATDSGNNVWIQRQANLVKRIDEAWANGTNTGGYASVDPIAADTWYHFHIIRNFEDGDVDACFDASVTATECLSDTNFEDYRRVGSVLTDSSSNIVQFVQVDDYFQWVDPPLDVDVTNQSTTAVSRTLSVPIDVQNFVLINQYVDHGSATIAYLSSLDVNDETPSSSAAPLGDIWDSSGEQTHGVRWILTDTSSQIRSIASASSTTLRIATLGWRDFRGRN